MNDKIASLLNQQITKEFYSAYLYLDMANFYDEMDLDGYSNYYMIQAQEERDHALLFMKYMQNNGLKVTLEAIDKPDKTFESVLDPLVAAAEHERYVTALINTIPGAVIGGISFLLYGMIGTSGLRILVDSKVDYNRTRNTVLSSVILVVGLSGVSIQLGSIALKGMSLAALVGMILSLLFYFFDKYGLMND